MSFTAKKVKKKISYLPMEAAAGPNGIGSMFLRELDVGLAPVLVMIFTKLMASGQVSKDWKRLT